MSTSLTNFLYTANSIPNAITMYANALLDEETLRSIQHAQKLLEFRDHYVTDRVFIAHLRDGVFNHLYDLIDEKEPNVRFLIEGRRKSLIKTEEKICLYEKRRKSLDLLRDMMAFRVILFGKDSLELIQKSYEVMEIIINFCVRNGFAICDAEDIKKDASTTTLEEANIIVPKKPLLSSEWRNCVKDYIRYPKGNGYQSLHVVFRHPDGRCFEVQVRTMDMHIRCELGSADHQSHDKTKYTDRINFDPSKVNMDGFFYSEDGQLLDYIGLCKSAQVILRRKSF